MESQNKSKKCSLSEHKEIDAIIFGVGGIVVLFQDVVRRLVVIEAQGVVYILGDPAPAAVVGTGAPHHIVVAGEVQRFIAITLMYSSTSIHLAYSSSV